MAARCRQHEADRGDNREQHVNGSLLIRNQGPSHRHSNVQRIGDHHTAEKQLPHSGCVILLMKVCSLVLFTFFFAIPIVLRLKPESLHWFMFPRYTVSPFHANYDDPDGHGLTNSFNFRLSIDPDITLGAWHILPASLELPRKEKLSFVDSRELLASGHPVVLYMHGNAGYRGSLHRVELYKRLSMAGYHVVVFDYRGYGDSSGRPSRKGMVEDGVTVFKYVRKLVANSSAKIIIWGHSLGTAIALETAKHLGEQEIDFGAIVLEAPFSSMYDVVNEQIFLAPLRVMPWFSWALIEGIKSADVEFRNDLNIVNVRRPILVLHAEDDLIVPIELGTKLYKIALNRLSNGDQTAATTVTFKSFNASYGYGHKNIYKHPELMTLLSEFLEGGDKTEKY